MPPLIVRDYQQQLIQTILTLARQQNWFSSPINLGGGSGPDGGSGIPIGDLLGQLIQSKVAFDTTEAESLDIPESGASLVTNLNRIRASKNPKIVVLDESTVIGSGIQTIEFHGIPVTVALVSGYTDRIVVSISGTGGLSLGGSGLVNVTANDTLAQYLDAKIAAGNRITTTVLNPGGSEQLKIDYVDFPINLDTLTNVATAGLADKDVLTYDTGASTWINQTAGEANLAISGHVHIETDITDLDHDAVKLRIKNISTAAPTDGQPHRWDSGASGWFPLGVLTVDEKIG